MTQPDHPTAAQLLDRWRSLDWTAVDDSTRRRHWHDLELDIDAFAADAVERAVAAERDAALTEHSKNLLILTQARNAAEYALAAEHERGRKLAEAVDAYWFGHGSSQDIFAALRAYEGVPDGRT